MKALILETEEDISNRTGKFEVATQWGHLNNDVWLYRGDVYDRWWFQTDYNPRFERVTEAELVL